MFGKGSEEKKQSLKTCHMGREHASREKKLSMVNFLIFVQMNIYIYKRIPKDENSPMEGF